MEGTPRPEASPNPNGRDQLGLTLGSKSVSLVTTNLVTILLILAGGLGGYAIFLNVQKDFARVELRQEQMATLLQTFGEKLVELAHDQEGLMREQTRMLYRWFLAHQANQGRTPDEFWPLELPPEQAPKRQEGTR